MSLRVLIVGTGGMANAHAEAFAAIEGVEVVGGVDTSPERLAAFCDKHQIPNRFASLDEALAWGQFDAATNVTPDAVHHRTTMPLLAAGKHVFVEKPLALDEAELARARRLDHVAGEQHLHRGLPPDGARQRHHRGRAEQANMHPRRAKLGSIGGNSQITTSDQLASGGGGNAHYLSNDGLGAVNNGLHHM